MNRTRKTFSIVLAAVLFAGCGVCGADGVFPGNLFVSEGIVYSISNGTREVADASDPDGLLGCRFVGAQFIIEGENEDLSALDPIEEAVDLELRVFEENFNTGAGFTLQEDALPNLRVVHGILDSDVRNTIEGLNGVEIANEVIVGRVEGLTSLRLVGGFFGGGSFPLLERVERDFTGSGVQPSLQSVGGNLEVFGGAEMPRLMEVAGGFTSNGSGLDEEVIVPLLEYVGSAFSIRNDHLLQVQTSDQLIATAVVIEGTESTTEVIWDGFVEDTSRVLKNASSPS